MPLRALCVVGFGLMMFGTPAQATRWLESFPQRSDHRSPGAGSGEQDASSIRLGSASQGVRFRGPSLVQLGELAPGLAQHSKKTDLSSWSLFRNGGTPFVPPGLSRKDGFPVAVTGPSLDPSLADEAVSAIPEPTGLLLFGSGLLLARAVRRRRPIPSTSW